jgi:hypothetical protein
MTSPDWLRFAYLALLILVTGGLVYLAVSNDA